MSRLKYRSKYKKVSVLPIRIVIVKSNVPRTAYEDTTFIMPLK